MKDPGIHVIKLGGSLLDWPGLADGIEVFRRSIQSGRVAMIVGGGLAADHVRGFDDCHGVGEEISHWLAIRAMALNTCLVATLLKRFKIVADLQECEGVWAAGDLALIEPLAWLEGEYREGLSIPHRWSFTSDSIAAYLATRLCAERLTLLKSALPEGDCDFARAGELGVVDCEFEAAAAGIPEVGLVNLRSDPLTHTHLRVF